MRSTTRPKKLSGELTYKMLLLQQRLAVLDELLLHTSSVVSPETSEYYVRVLNKYGNFFNAVTLSLKSSLYVELLAYLGVKMNAHTDIIDDRWATDSVYNLSALCSRQADYLALINRYKTVIVQIDEVRHHIAHAKKQEELNNLTVPSYDQMVGLLNDVSSFLMEMHDELHGIPGWNTPHHLEENNPYSDDTEELIHAAASSSNSEKMRSQYLKAKKDMRMNKRKIEAR